MSNHAHLLGKEHPYSHYFQIIAALVFFPIWLLDSFVFKISIGLARFVPWFLRLIVSLLVIIIAIVITRKAEDVLFKEKYDPPTIIDKGILAHVRHPLYLGTLLIYLGFIFGTFSIISFLIFLIVFFLYNKIATYEEQDLERIFGEEYLEYKSRVPKWIPHLSSVKPTNSED